jgi:iron complex transport system substrate-binding protein
MRIVSLLPSATETLFALGLDEKIVGVSHECDFPPQAKTRKSVVRSRLPKDATPSEIDRLVREHVERGESIYAVDRDILEELAPWIRAIWAMSGEISCGLANAQAGASVLRSLWSELACGSLRSKATRVARSRGPAWSCLNGCSRFM